MSRCFPFPPPGYERKHRPEDLDVLKELKRKEKRHKKENEKERKKEKEKGKDKSDEKQKDKKERKKHKDKKEKHKDKKKSKEDRSKDKEKSSISEESTVSGVKLEDKLHAEGHSKDKSHAVDERKHCAPFQGQNGQKPSHSSFSLKRNNELKLVQEFDGRIRDDGSRGSQLPPLVDERDQRIAAKAAVGNSAALLANEKSKGVDDMQKIGNMSSGKAGIEVDRIVGPMDGQKIGGLEVKEKLKETGEAKVGEKRKDRDKKSHGKEKDKEKEKNKKEKREKVKTENKKSKEVKLGEIGRNAFVSSLSGNKSTGSLKEVNNIGELNEGNLRKRKDTCTNGFGHEMETTANKIQRHAPHHQSIENGRKLEACRTPTKSYDEHTVPNNVSMDGKSRLINGIVKGKEPFPSVPQNSSAVISQEPVPALPKIPKSKSISLKEKPTLPNIEDLIAEALKRPPHPDSKYLSEVLTIPNVAGLSEDEDQDWLFRKKDLLDKPKDESIRLDKEPRVWSEAVRIELADICALPFVIPY